MNPLTHVTDDLELYALDALPSADRARVDAHLAGCPVCREQARALEEVAIALPGTLPERDVPARVRDRILTSARVPLASPAVRRSWSITRGRLVIAGLAAAVIVLGATNVLTVRQLNDVAAERDQYGDVVQRVSHGGKSWYMSGRDQWTGSGGTLYSPRSPDAAAFVVFHDLRPVTTGAVYTLWLVDQDGHWTRAANFAPNGEVAQAVILDTSIEGFMQCAVTVELQREGKRAGPLVMQSRLGSPSSTPN